MATLFIRPNGIVTGIALVPCYIDDDVLAVEVDEQELYRITGKEHIEDIITTIQVSIESGARIIEKECIAGLKMRYLDTNNIQTLKMEAPQPKENITE